MKRDLRGPTDQRASPAFKWLIDKAVGAGELQRAGRWVAIPEQYVALQTAYRVKVLQPFKWIAGTAMLEAGYNTRGIAE